MLLNKKPVRGSLKKSFPKFARNDRNLFFPHVSEHKLVEAHT